MARKRKKIKDLRGVDPTTQAYWDEVLRREGFSMDAGRNTHETYVGGASSVEYIEGVLRDPSGRVVPKAPLE